jgi:hypothetical protein
MRKLISNLVVVLSVALVGCANPSIVRVNDTALQKVSISKIYVPRFEGKPDFVEESTDLFVTELESQISIPVTQGTVIRAESADVLAGGNLAPVEQAIAAAKKSGAQVLIMGKVTSHNTGFSLNGFSTVRVIDVQSGDILASFHRPSGLLMAYSEHQTVLAAVSRTADDVASVFKKK